MRPVLAMVTTMKNNKDTRNTYSTAREILRTHWNGVIPIDIEAIAKNMGIKLKAISDYSISGRFFKDPHSNEPNIEISIIEPYTRQRFTLAHEIGHYALGHGDKIDETASLYRKSYDHPCYLETEANKFAAELLMPKVAIDYAIDKEDIDHISVLAQRFQVSEVAMQYRLKNLGYL